MLQYFTVTGLDSLDFYQFWWHCTHCSNCWDLETRQHHHNKVNIVYYVSNYSPAYCQPKLLEKYDKLNITNCKSNCISNYTQLHYSFIYFHYLARPCQSNVHQLQILLTDVSHTLCLTQIETENEMLWFNKKLAFSLELFIGNQQLT